MDIVNLRKDSLQARLGHTIFLLPGSQGCGKTLLIKSLAANAEPGSVTKHAASVPTTGQVSPSVPQID